VSWGAFERKISSANLVEMSAGYIQLAAIGQQDAYLTGSPQVTYFSGVYKRHTPFVLEAYDIPFQNQEVVYGQNNICRIPPKGDLIRALTLKVDLPALFDPGTFWAWDIVASATTFPHIIINGTYFSLPYQGITYYSTYNQSSWVSTTLASFVSYSNATNQFIFSNCATLEVDQNGGVFWGLDPKVGAVSPTNSSNLIYTVGTSQSNAAANSIATSNLSANYISNVVSTRPSDFTLQQAGWVQSTGLPLVNTRTSLFLSLPAGQTYSISGATQSFLNFYNWTNQDTVATYAVTTNGRLKFTNTGFYIVRAGFSLGTGSVLNIAYGSDPQENIYPNGIPIVPQFAYSCDFRVSPDPSMPLLMPLVVASTANTYYFYATTTSTVTQFTPGTYLTVTPVDDLYMFNTNTPVLNNIVPFYSNVVPPQNTTVTLGTDHSMTFSSTGTWLLSGVIYLQQAPKNYVANVSVWNTGSATPDYAYTTLSLQGRDPTIAFSMPIVVTSTSQKYYTNVYSDSAITILNTSYYSITQIGAETYTGYETVLSNNGILLNPSTEIQPIGPDTPLNFKTNFSLPAGTNSTIISVNQTTGNLQFSNIATYMLTAVLSSSDNVKSITFGTNTYNFDIGGLFPQYTVTVPYRVTQIATDVPITITTDYNVSVGSDITATATGATLTGTVTSFSDTSVTMTATGVTGGAGNINYGPWSIQLGNSPNFIYYSSSQVIPGILSPPNSYTFTLGGSVGSAVTATSSSGTGATLNGTITEISSISMTMTVSSKTGGAQPINYDSWTIGIGSSPIICYSSSTAIAGPLTESSYTFSINYNYIFQGNTTNIFSNTYISVYPVASNVIPTISYNYYDSVGTWLINRAELIIGGQTIQTLTGEFIEIYNDLYVPYENQPGLKLLTGKYDTSTQIYPPGRTYFINLPFYFFQNAGLYLPLVSLERQDVEIHVTFRNLQELTAVNTSSITTPLTATIITEYVYLAEPEINWFKKSQIDYLVQQCQYQEFDLAAQFTTAIFNLEFINPIRELFFIVQLSGTTPYEYSDLNSLAMNFNASEAFTADVTDALYLNSLEPFEHYTNYPTRQFYMYSFTNQANTPRPYGQVNFSRIRDIFLQVNTNAYSSPKQLRVIGINYNILRIKDGIAGLMFNSNDF
jgi:hypothetical protein